jgi:dTDP-4-amino-4,6-dideoxygalactose transaminase
VLVDSNESDCWISLEGIRKAITPRTKVIMPVDIAGNPIDYSGIHAIIEAARSHFRPQGENQKALGRILFLSDAAHSFGATYKGKPVGMQADITGYSFHAVKNLTTAEGGALAFNLPAPFENEALKGRFKISSLHGQTKDALSKSKAGAWRYDVIEAGYKCNMTDLHAAIGRVELKRYAETLAFRKMVCLRYTEAFSKHKVFAPPIFEVDGNESSYHLYLLRLNGYSETQRDSVITKLAEANISANVHFQPLPLLTYYKNLGYKMVDYPNAFAAYENEISLPVWYGMSDEMLDYVIEQVEKAVSSL